MTDDTFRKIPEKFIGHDSMIDILTSGINTKYYENPIMGVFNHWTRTDK